MRQRRWLFITALAMVLALGLMLTWAVPATAGRNGATTPPNEAVAFARLAVVRLAAQYSDQATGTPSPVLCTGLGTIIATTGGGNTQSFILTDGRLVSPTDPCGGAVEAYTNANGGKAPTAWKLDRVDGYLNTSYTGNSIVTLALTPPTLAVSGPVLLPLQAEKPYDLPTVPLGNNQSVSKYLIDLGDANANPYTRDTIVQNVIGNQLIPVENATSIPGTLPTPTPTLAPTATPSVTVTAAPTATSVPPTATPAKKTTPQPTATATVALSPTAVPPFAIAPGAPVFDESGDGYGHLVGIIVQTPDGKEQLAGPENINVAVSNTTAKPNTGTFSQTWHDALRAFYGADPSNAKDPQFDTAAQKLTSLSQSYPDFHGIDLWLAAAKAHSKTLGGPTPTAIPSPTPKATSTGFSLSNPFRSTQGVITAGVALVILLLGLFFWGRAFTAGRRQQGKSGSQLPEESDRPDTARLPAYATNGYGAVPERRAEDDDKMTAWRLNSLRPTVPLAQNRKVNRMGLHAAGLTDPGVKRKNDPNQDSILALHGARLHEGAPQAFGLFVVADGMGGHQNGREASIHAIETLVDAIVQPLVDGSALSDDALLDLLKTGVEKANSSLHRRNLRQHGDMGTTITAALVTGDIAHLANVGDSRIYHLQPQFSMRQITVDHSVVAGLVAAGVIRPDEIYTHPKRNQIYRSLGEKDEVDVDTFRLILQPGDLLLLCSDGLWEMIRDPQIEGLLRSKGEPHEVANRLIEEANANGGVDNVSAVIVKMLGDEAAPQTTGMHIYAGPPTLIGHA